MRRTPFKVAVPFALLALASPIFAQEVQPTSDSPAEDMSSLDELLGEVDEDTATAYPEPAAAPTEATAVSTSKPAPPMVPAEAEAEALDTIPLPRDADSLPVAPRQAAPPPMLEEIVVTAQRRVESAQKASVALAVVDGMQMSKDGIVDTRRLTEKIPALVSNGTSNFVRGVGTFSQFGYTDPAVAVNYDGVYIGRSTSVAGLYFDLERVELLKGPQGTLYGRNATGGAINVLPVKPQFGENTAFGSISGGSYQSYNGEAALNWAVTEDTAIRLAGLINRRDGFFEDGLGDRDITSLRLQSMTQLTDDVSLRLGADWSHIGGYGEGRDYASIDVYDEASSSWMVVDSGLSPREGLYSPASQQFRSTIYSVPAGRNLEPLEPKPFQDYDFPSLNAELNWNTDVGTVTVVPAWRGYDLNTLVGNASPTQLTESGNQFSLEARLSDDGDGAFGYTLGGFLYREDIESDATVNQQIAFVRQLFESTTNSSAVFGRLIARVNDEFRLVGGLRYTQDKKDFTGQADGLVLLCVPSLLRIGGCPRAQLFQPANSLEGQPFPVPAQGGPPVLQGLSGALIVRQTTDVDTNLKQGKLTYRGAIEYDVAEESMLYLSYETGFRSGGFSIANGYETYDPEEIKAITLGMKNRFFGAIQLNIEVFNWDYSNQQLNHIGPDRNGQTNLIIQNVGTSYMRGGEIDLRAALSPTTRVGVGIQYLDAKYDEFRYLVSPPKINPALPNLPLLTPPLPLVGCPSRPAGQGEMEIDCSGQPSFNAPKWTLNFMLSHGFDISDYRLTVGAETQFRSDYVVGFEYREFQKQSSYWRSGLSLGFAPQDESRGWSVDAFVRNLEDSDTLVLAIPMREINMVSYMEPRTFGLRFTQRFE